MGEEHQCAVCSAPTDDWYLTFAVTDDTTAEQVVVPVWLCEEHAKENDEKSDL